MRGTDKPPSGERADLLRELRGLGFDNMSPEEEASFRSGNAPKINLKSIEYWADKPQAVRERAEQIIARLEEIKEPESGQNN